MGPKTKQLVDVLSELADLLHESGDTHWQEWILEARSRLIASDFSGIGHLLKAYGGMGSFNDLVLEPRPDVLRSLAVHLANEIKDNASILGA